MKKFDVKAKVEEIRKKDKLHYEALRNHDKKIVTRRDFVAHGLLGATSFAIAPSILNSAFAQSSPSCSASSGNNTRLPYLTIDCAGGATFTSCFTPKVTDGGDYISNSGFTIHGVGNTNNPRNTAPDMDAGTPMITNSGLYRGLQAVLTPAQIAKLSVVLIPNRSVDDSPNPNNQATAIAGLLNGTDNPVVGRDVALSPYNRAGEIGSNIPQFVVVNGSTDATNLVNTGKLGEAFASNNTNIARYFDFLKAITNRNVASFSKEDISDPLRHIIGCSFENAKKSITAATPAEYDPSTKTEIASVFNGNGTYDSPSSSLASLTWLIAKGYAGAGKLGMDDYDYHGRGANTQDSKNQDIGEAIGRFVAVNAGMNQSCMIQLTGDGGAASPRNGNEDQNTGLIAHTSDNENVCSNVLIVYNANDKVDMLKTQIGTYRNSGETDAASITSVPLNAQIATIVNFCSLTGRLNEAEQILQKHGLTLPASIDDLLAFGTLK